jgi:hypothetical protein
MRRYADQTILEVDAALCQLHSLGTVVTQISNLESEEPDLTALADIGRIITSLSMNTLNVIQDGERFEHPLDSKQPANTNLVDLKQFNGKQSS